MNFPSSTDLSIQEQILITDLNGFVLVLDKTCPVFSENVQFRTNERVLHSLCQYSTRGVGSWGGDVN